MYLSKCKVQRESTKGGGGNPDEKFTRLIDSRYSQTVKLVMNSNLVCQEYSLCCAIIDKGDSIDRYPKGIVTASRYNIEALSTGDLIHEENLSKLKCFTSLWGGKRLMN